MGRYRRIAMTAAALSAAVMTNAVAQNVMNSLGVKEDDVKRQAVGALIYNHAPVYMAARAFKAADSTMRVKMVQGAMAWIKAYTESAAFKADYEKQRESAKPAPPKPRESVDAQLAKQKAERQKNLEEMKKSLEKMPPDMRKSMEGTVKQMEAMYAQQDANPQMAAMMRQGLEAQGADEQRAYKERIADYDRKYPADPRTLIAQRLQEFLDLSRDVNYDAKLYRDDRGKMKFVDGAYENKPDDWKTCYRAGKPAVDAARTLASVWLKELRGK